MGLVVKIVGELFLIGHCKPSHFAPYKKQSDNTENFILNHHFGHSP